MNYPKLLSLVATASVYAATFTSGQNVLINEDFNNPLDGSTNNTQLVNNTTAFPDWNWSDGGGNQPTYKVGGGDAIPVNSGDGHIKMDTINNFSNLYTVQYDTGHSWSADDQFTFSINATEQSWNSGDDRYMVISIRETARSGNNLTGAVLWTVTEELVLDPNHDSGAEGWGPNNTFSYSFNAADFTTGTVGTSISLEIAGLIGTPEVPSGRGWHFDNVYFDVTAVPEPSAFALIGLAGMALLVRRRR